MLRPKPKVFTKTKTPNHTCLRRLHKKLLTVISLMTLAAVLSASVPAKNNSTSSAIAASANNFAIGQPIFAASFWDFFSFLGFDSNSDKSQNSPRRPVSPGDEAESKDANLPQQDFAPTTPSLAAPCTSANPSPAALSVSPGDSIQNAINQADPNGGTVITVADGTYTEQLVINKCLTIVGQSEAGVIIKAPATLAISQVSNVNARAIVEVRANSYATVSKITVSGPVTLGESSKVYGMMVNETSVLKLTDARVTDIRDAGGVNSDNNGYGVLAGSPTRLAASFNQIGAIDFDNVTIDGYNKNAIVVGRIGSNANIINSNLTGAGSQTFIAQNGIVVGDGATATITNNTIKNNICGAAGCAVFDFNSDFQFSDGVLLFQSGTSTISGNTFDNNDGAVYSWTPGFGSTVSNNTISNPRYTGIDLDQGTHTVNNNFINGAGFTGIRALTYNGNTANTNVSLQSNSITGKTQAGIELDKDAAATPFPTITSADFNRIAGNGKGIDNNTTTSTVSQTNNFWGCNLGPNGGMGCDTTDGLVDVSTPYLRLTGTSASPTAVNTGGTSTVSGTILRVNSDNVNTYTVGGPHVLDGIPVSYSATNGTVSPTSTTLVNGAAVAPTTFTGGGPFSGNQTGSATASVDNANDTVNITVNDTTAPTAVIAVAGGQPNPTSNLPINFTVTFSDAGTSTPVITGFDGSDISFDGTADTSGAVVTVTGGTNGVYNVEVSGIVGNGTVIPYVEAGAATDPAGNANAVDSNKDASVNYISPAPRDCTMLSPPYNVELEFSLGSNPNCEFTYGYTATSNADSLFTNYPNRQVDFPVDGIDRWYLDNPDPDLVPAVFGNRNPSTTTYGSVQQPADALNLHPGPGVNPDTNGPRSVVRFITPSAGAGFNKISGRFEGIDTNGTTTDVTIIRRSGMTSTVLFSGNINGFGNMMPFDIPVTLAAGDIIDFSVGTGGNGYGSDSTALAATISPVTLVSETLYGLVGNGTTQSLVSFNSTNPNVATTSVAITGLGSGETLVGIDFRPRNGILYGVTTDDDANDTDTDGTGRIYTINPSTGVAMAINNGNTVVGNNVIRTGPGAPVVFSGTNFGVDFNPAADRIRVVSDTGQNLRINPDTGVTVVDGAINPAANSVTAAAYTNNTFPSASTVLYDIDANNDTLYTQNPPNNGTLVAVGTGLGVDASAINGFDISSTGSMPAMGMTPAVVINNAYASFTTNNGATTSDLYTINLMTGTASRVGKIGTAENSGTGLSITGLTVGPAVLGTDATFPTVTSIAYGTPATSPTNANSVDFAVTFSEPVNGVDAGDFALATTGVSGASIASVTSTCTTPTTPCATYTVTVNTGTGDGTVGLNLVDNDSIVDTSKNALGGAGNNGMMPSNPTNTSGDGSFTGAVYTIDRTTPTVTVTGQAMDPTNTALITFTVDFSETVTGFIESDVMVANGTITSFTNNNDTTYTITVTATMDGDVTLTVPAGAAQDTAGNNNAGPVSDTVVFDATAPTVTIDQAANQPDPTTASPINFTVVFSSPVIGFTSSDVTVGGTAFGANSIKNVVVTDSGDQTTYNVAVSGMNTSGTVTADVNVNAANDAAGNSSSASTSMDNTVQFNQPASVATVISPADTMGWIFAPDLNSMGQPFGASSGSFVEGPGGPLAVGDGSARLTVDSNGREILYRTSGTEYGGVRLNQVTALSYRTYNNNNANTAAALSFQFDVDNDVTDPNNAFQGRLVYEPSNDTGQPVQQGVWQNWDLLSPTARFYGSSGSGTRPVTAFCSISNPCTRAQLLAQFPNIGIRNAPASIILLKAGGPVGSNFDGNGDNLVIGVNSTGKTFDFEPDPPTVSIGNATISETNAGTMTADFTVTLSVASQLETKVTVTTADVTATSPSDYTAKTAVVTIPIGSTTGTFSVTVNDDNIDEPDETFTATLSNAVNAKITGNPGTGTITDDEGQPQVTLVRTATSDVTEGGTATFSAQISGASSTATTVSVMTTPGTAMTPADYSLTTMTVTFPANSTTAQPISVTTVDDAIFEPTAETYAVSLGAVTAGTADIGDPSSQNATITDNDNCNYTVSPASPANFGPAGGNGSFTVTVASGCSVTASSNDGFITNVTVSADTGTGSRTVSYTVASNAGMAGPNGNNGAARTGTISFSVNGVAATYTINQGASAVTIDIPDDLQAINGATLTVPVNVTSNTTGRNITSFDFIVSYEPAVFGPPTSVSNTAFSSGFSVAFTPLSGNRVQVSGFSDTPLTDSGTLVNINFPIVGSNPNCGALTFDSFDFNEGDPADSTSNGQACVISGTVTGRVIYGNNRTMGTQTNPNGTDDSATARPVPNTTLTGVPSTTGQPTVTGMSVCPDGMYSLVGFGTGTYTVTPSKVRNNDANGITSQDASRIQQAVLGSVTLTPRQMRVADVSKNGAVTSFDASLIQQYILNPTTASNNPQNNTGKWEFDPMNRVYTSTAANMMGQDYDALLLGEVTGSWVSPCGSTTPTIVEDDFRNAGNNVTASGNRASASNIVAAGIPVTLPNSTTSAGMSFDVAINVGDLTGQNVTSYDFDILYDPAVIQPQTTQTDKNATISNGLTVGSTIVEPGKLRVSAFGSTPVSGSGVLLKLKFTAVGANGTTSNLSFAPFMFNEGLPSNMTNIGQVRVLAPTAAAATVSGRVTTVSRRGISEVTVILTDSNGVSRSAAVNLKGFYQFDGVRTGETYVINVSGKGITGTEQVITVSGNLADVNLTF